MRGAETRSPRFLSPSSWRRARRAAAALFFAKPWEAQASHACSLHNSGRLHLARMDGDSGRRNPARPIGRRSRHRRDLLSSLARCAGADRGWQVNDHILNARALPRRVGGGGETAKGFESVSDIGNVRAEMQKRGYSGRRDRKDFWRQLDTRLSRGVECLAFRTVHASLAGAKGIGGRLFVRRPTSTRFQPSPSLPPKSR